MNNSATSCGTVGARCSGVDHEQRAAPAPSAVQAFAQEQRRHDHDISGLAVRPRHANQAA
jgi:hypothetical protein